MRRKLREHTSAAGDAGALSEAREYARRTGRMPADWQRTPGAVLACGDQFAAGCTWSGTEGQASINADDVLCCPRCGSIL